jgi:predicted NBD/HSP70 family sugar kinase
MGRSAVGVDLGGTKIAVALVNEQGRILKSSRLATDVEGSASAVVAQITESVNELAGNSDSSVAGIGVGVAGQIEAQSGIVRFAPNLDWHDVPLQSQLSAACNLPVVITNDVRVITWGEWLFGAGKGCDNLIGAFVGTGIGGGVIDGLPELVERVRREVGEKALAAATGSLQVVSAKLDEDAGVIGVAALAMQSRALKRDSGVF